MCRVRRPVWIGPYEQTKTPHQTARDKKGRNTFAKLRKEYRNQRTNGCIVKTPERNTWKGGKETIQNIGSLNKSHKYMFCFQFNAIVNLSCSKKRTGEEISSQFMLPRELEMRVEKANISSIFRISVITQEKAHHRAAHHRAHFTQDNRFTTTNKRNRSKVKNLQDAMLLSHSVSNLHKIVQAQKELHWTSLRVPKQLGETRIFEVNKGPSQRRCTYIDSDSKTSPWDPQNLLD